MIAWWMPTCGETFIDNRQKPMYYRETFNVTKDDWEVLQMWQNIAALGRKPILCSVIGEDDEGFFKLLKNQNLSSEGILKEKRKLRLKHVSYAVISTN